MNQPIVPEREPDIIPTSIALTGYSRVGKDACCVQPLVERFRYKRIAFGDFIKRQLDMTIRVHFGFSAFTDDTEEKAKIRQILEAWGDARYDSILYSLTEKIEEHRSFGYPCVNARLARVEEGRAWKRSGGIIVRVMRDGVGPSTQWELERVSEIERAGLVDLRVTLPDGVNSAREAFIEAMKPHLKLQNTKEVSNG